MALNTEESVVAVEAGDGLAVDNPATFGGTVTLKVSASELTGSFLSEDANGDLQVNLGAFLQGDAADNIEVQIGRGLADDGTGNIEVDFADGEVLSFGTDDDVGLSYSATNDSLIVTDLQTSTDQIELDQTSGNINLSGSLTEGATL